MSALAQLALRAQALAIVVCTTGSTTLEATANGYARASGSFLVDGFMPGMEVTPVGFTQTARGVISFVDATTMTIVGGRTVQAAGASRSLSVNTPSIVRYGNREPQENGIVLPNLVQGRPWWREEMAAGGNALTTTTQRGWTLSTGIYYMTWAGLANYDEIGIHRCADAVRAAFPPEAWVRTLADGSTLRVTGNPAPFTGQIAPSGPAWAVARTRIPWELLAQLP